MKRYATVLERAIELDARGFVKDRDIFIPGGVEPDTLTCNDGILYSYPAYKSYYLQPNKTLEHIRYYHNANTGECNVWFGTSFFFDGPLFNLPKEKDGKRVHVLGLTPYTVELEINIRPDKATEAYWLTVNISLTSKLIDNLKAIAVV